VLIFCGAVLRAYRHGVISVAPDIFPRRAVLRCLVKKQARGCARLVAQLRAKSRHASINAAASNPAARSVTSSWTAFIVPCFLVLSVPVRAAQAEGLSVADAWVPPVDEVGRDVPLLLTIRNETSSPDALTRVSCPVANFSEKHIVDRGEGAPAMRAISSIPVSANSTIVLKPTEYHVMLLQTRQTLAIGESFSCALAF
jgi:copper(I)-binding protein